MGLRKRSRGVEYPPRINHHAAVASGSPRAVRFGGGSDANPLAKLQCPTRPHHRYTISYWTRGKHQFELHVKILSLVAWDPCGRGARGSWLALKDEESDALFPHTPRTHPQWAPKPPPHALRALSPLLAIPHSPPLPPPLLLILLLIGWLGLGEEKGEGGGRRWGGRRRCRRAWWRLPR